MKRARKKLPKGIRKLRDGTYLVDIRDSQKKRHRKIWPTQEEAEAYRDSISKQKATGRFYATAANKTFTDALDLRRKEMITDGLDKATIDRFDQDRKKHIEPNFGPWKLSDFFDDRMEGFKQWLEQRKEDGASKQTMDHYKSIVRQTFNAAISIEGWMPPPNPVDAFNVKVPHVPKQKRKPFSIDDMTAFMRGAITRGAKGGGSEQELAHEMRLVAAVLGLDMPWRDQDICGLCWDSVNLEQRIMFIRRVVKKVDRGDGNTVWSLEEDTKTGEEGFGELHMPPMSHAMLSRWQVRLDSLGMPTSGEVPVLRTKRVSLVTPTALASNHIETIMTKAGLLNENGGLKYTWYHLRHTVPSMWGAIGVSIDDIQDWMRHEDYNTTKKHYKHRVQEYVAVLRPAVDAVIERLGLERTAHGLIDALSIALALMFRAKGIDVAFSEPTSLRQKRLPNYHQDAPSTIGSNVIDLVPTAVRVEAPPPLEQMVMSTEQITKLRRAEAKRLNAPPHSWGRNRIADHLGVCSSTVATWLDDADDVPWMRKTSLADRADLGKRIAQMHDDGSTSKAIARALRIPSEYVRAAERRRGRPFGAEPRRRRSWKLEPHEAAIRAKLAEGKKPLAIARELGLKKSGIYYFLERIGLRPIKDAKLKARVAAASKPAPNQDECPALGGNSQLQLDLGSIWTVGTSEDAAD